MLLPLIDSFGISSLLKHVKVNIQVLLQMYGPAKSSKLLPFYWGNQWFWAFPLFETSHPPRCLAVDLFRARDSLWALRGSGRGLLQAVVATLW